MTIGIVWHMRDLRTEWNPALSAASAECDRVIPLYIYSEDLEKMGEASLWWLHHSLEELSDAYHALGLKLLYLKGDPEKVLHQLISKTGATNLYFNANFEPTIFKLEKKLCKAFEKGGVQCHVFNGNHLIDPREIEVKPGKPYSVFTPFYKACEKHLHLPKKPPLPRKIQGVSGLKSDKLSLLPKKSWIEKLENNWKPGRKEGLKSLNNFTTSRLTRYAKERDFPGIKGTSTLSPYLHFGEISPYEVYLKASSEPFRRQLFWREFGTYFLFHFPKAAKENWNSKFDAFKWDNKPSFLRKWKEGKTGYPIVDAGMRELYETGWMHNRVRMIVASFLIKDLFIHWKEGEKWFWDTLVDADKANNVLGWQWTAGSGPDAAPYFRIFNPVLQGLKFDPSGSYIRKYVPELAKLPNKWIHHPWEAPKEVLEEAGVELGKTYPEPIVEHRASREEALKRFQKIK